MPNLPYTANRNLSTVNGYSQGYLGGFDVFATAAPSDGIPVVTLWAQARPSAWLIGPGLAAVLAQINTYYGAGKAATVLHSLGVDVVSSPGAAGGSPGFPYAVVNADLVSYQVLATDLVTQAAALLALMTAGTNTNKGGNP
jgi:hypothetical protein